MPLQVQLPLHPNSWTYLAPLLLPLLALTSSLTWPTKSKVVSLACRYSTVCLRSNFNWPLAFSPWPNVLLDTLLSAFLHQWTHVPPWPTQDTCTEFQKYANSCVREHADESDGPCLKAPVTALVTFSE
jgi:hypothetical protein